MMVLKKFVFSMFNGFLCSMIAGNILWQMATRRGNPEENRLIFEGIARVVGVSWCCIPLAWFLKDYFDDIESVPQRQRLTLFFGLFFLCFAAFGIGVALSQETQTRWQLLRK